MDSSEGKFLLGFVLLGVAPVVAVFGAGLTIGIMILGMLIAVSAAFSS
jgi:hypothetical protein